MDEQLVRPKLGQRPDLSRQELLALHPLPNREPVETAELVCVYRLVKLLVLIGGDGCCIEGASCSGRSTLIASTALYLQADFPKIPHYVYTTQSSALNDREFLESWLAAIGHEFRQGRDRTLRQRIHTRFVNAAASLGARKIILLIDNAQFMHTRELDFLVDVRGELARHGITLVTVFFGDIGTANALRKLAGDESPGMWSLNLTFQLSGLSSDDVQAVFDTLDALPFFEAGTTWTQFFMQQAWEKKWRLADHVTTFYAGLEKSRLATALRTASGKGKGERPDVPAGLLFMTLRRFLPYVGSLGDRFKLGDMPSYWDIAIRTSGYTSSDQRLSEALPLFGLPRGGQSGRRLP
ncbi:hypothetical protein [Paraburkholderia sp.]|uniref:hypothetical protein n=1 Tax=Paraburkholderia sp. TaxID=1926495 RepID=UPI0025F447B7|nr:hypothetical protein [Paraburkholderia sp.]